MSKGVHRFALLLAAATFCLIVAGALVTSHDAGLATADWPLTEGQFLPKAESLGINSGVNMVGNLFWEHGHRMIAYENNVNANLIIPIDAAMAVDSRARRTV